jgi:hypothetical protein
LKRSVLVLFAVLALATPASAQIAWDSPPFISPVAPAGVSLFFLNGTGDRLGALATLRHEAGPVGLGYRLAVTEEYEPGDAVIAGGVDVSGFLARGVENADIDVVWWSGLGAGVGNQTVVSVPLGLVVGWSGSSEGGVIFSPYGGGHVALDFASGEGDSVSFSGAFDVGGDIVLTSGWMIRFGATFGDREALAVGFKLPS